MQTPFNKPIVCGTDFSPNAQDAADAAAALARRLGVPLLLTHAEAMPLDSDFAKAWLAPVRASLHEEAERLRAKGTEVEEIFTAGLPDESLAQLALERQAALLVVSSLGRRLPARWLIGSVAERTAESAPVPTLVVRKGSRFEAWALGQAALKVYVGVDFSSNSDAALRWIKELRQIGEVEVTALYVDWPPKERGSLGVYGPLGLVDNEPGAQQHIERDLARKVVKQLGSEEKLTISVEGSWGSVDAHLVNEASRAEADLIVIGTHQWHGLKWLRHGSVSRAVVRHAPMSVVCVPTPPPVVVPASAPAIQEVKRVIVAVDLNERDELAASYAFSVVKPGGRVRLVHVQNRLPAPPLLLGEAVVAPESQGDDAEAVARAEAKLRALAPDEAAAQGITTEVEIIDAVDAARAISEAAERFNADVVCIGGHTRPGFVAKVMGSVALGVLTHCKRPVLVVRPPEQ